MKHLHVSRKTDASSSFLLKSLISPDRDSQEKSPPRPLIVQRISSIDERLYMNFTETCPLFLLKEGIDHRFEFLDFAPDLYIRQQFHPIDYEELRLHNTESQLDSINSAHTSSTHLLAMNLSSSVHPPTEVE